MHLRKALKHLKTGKKIRLTACLSHSHIHISSSAKSYSFLGNGFQAAEGNGHWEKPDTKVYRRVSAYDKTSKQQNSHAKMCTYGKKCKVFFQNNTVPPRPELSFLKEVQPSVSIDNRDTVVGDTCVSSSVG